jgi:hypothetical protein
LISGTSASQPSISTLRKFVDVSVVEVEAGGVEVSDFGDASDGSVFGVNFGVAALEDPFQDAAVEYAFLGEKDAAFKDLERQNPLRRGQ